MGVGERDEKRRLLRDAVQLAAFGAALVALVGVSWRFVALGRPVFWLPGALITGMLLRNERRRWPLLLGAVPVSLLVAGAFGYPPERALSWQAHLFWAFANGAAPLATAGFVSAVVGTPIDLQRPREVTIFVLASLTLTPTIDLCLNLAADSAGLGLEPHGLAPAIALRYLGQYAAPVIIVAPLIVTWPVRLPHGFSLQAGAELLAALLLLTLLTLAGFLQPTAALQYIALAVAAFPALGWMAARFGSAVGAQGAFALALTGSWLTFTGHGPFGDPALGWQRLLFVQSFYATATISALLVAAESESRRRHERRRAEALALVDRLYREAQAAVQVRDDFLTTASHELRTPLTPLSIRLQRLRREIAAGKTGDMTTVDRAIASLERLGRLINDLLDASRIAQGRLATHFEQVNLGRVVRDAAIESVREPQRHPIQFDIPEESILVRADRARIAQVVKNLVDNAIKYSPGGAPIRVRIREEDGNAVVSVQDEGIGVPPEQLPLLFDRFFRARNVTSRSYGGLGLGLYIVQDIVTHHGGRVWAESEPGKGSTFYFSLPLLERERAEPSPPAVPVRPPGAPPAERPVP